MITSAEGLRSKCTFCYFSFARENLFTIWSSRVKRNGGLFPCTHFSRSRLSHTRVSSNISLVFCVLDFTFSCQLRKQTYYITSESVFFDSPKVKKIIKVLENAVKSNLCLLVTKCGVTVIQRRILRRLDELHYCYWRAVLGNSRHFRISRSFILFSVHSIIKEHSVKKFQVRLIYTYFWVNDVFEWLFKKQNVILYNTALNAQINLHR